jgi:hypothetical protein
LQFLIKKIFFSSFGHQNPGSRTGPGSALKKKLDPDPDPQPCLEVGFGEEVAMAAGAAIGPEVVVGAGVRVQAAPGTEHLGGPTKIYGKSLINWPPGSESVISVADPKHPGFRIRFFFHPGSRIRIKIFLVF